MYIDISFAPRLKELHNSLNRGEKLDSYADTVAEIKHILRNTVIPTNSGIIPTIKRSIYNNVTCSVTANMILQDIVDVLTTDTVVEFTKYFYLLEGNEIPSNKLSKLKINITQYSGPYQNIDGKIHKTEIFRTMDDELLFLFKKGGIKLVVNILLVLALTYNHSRYNIHSFR